METSIELTLFFEEPFWVGIFKKKDQKECKISKFTFGSEPKAYEVYDFILKNFYNLRFSDADILKEKVISSRKISPKRLQREINKEMKNTGAVTKSQAVIKIQYEKNKIAVKKISKEKRYSEQERKFEIRKMKKVMKHKGH